MKIQIHAILMLLGLAAFFYKILPTFTSMTDSIAAAIAARLQESNQFLNFCTKEVGEGLCCQLHLEAEPCVDECRKAFLDRQTFRPTKEYRSCADACFLAYRTTCHESPLGSDTKDEVRRSDNRAQRTRRQKPSPV